MTQPREGWSAAVKVCAVVLALAVVALLAQMGHALRTREQMAAEAATVSALRVELRALAQRGQAVRDGRPQAAAGFQAARTTLAAHVRQRVEQMAAARQGEGHDIDALIAAWKDIDSAARVLESNQRALREASMQLAHALHPLPAFKTELDEWVRGMVASGAAASQVYLALHQVMLLDDIEARLKSMAAGGDTLAAEAEELGEDIATFARVLTGLQRGDAQMVLQPVQGRRARARLEQLHASWAQVQPLLEQIAGQAPLRLAAHAAAATLEQGSDALMALAQVARAHAPAWPHWLGWGAGGLALLTALGLWQALRRERVEWQDEAAHLRHREHDAFARLLDEMGALAEGDLTIKASVSGDITGSLAEAINFAARQLGTRLHGMLSVLPSMATQAGHARAAAMELSEVSQYQLQELSAALEQVQHLRGGMDMLRAQRADAGDRAWQQAARTCADAAQDIAAMLDTLNTVTIRLNGQARHAREALDALTHSLNALRELADGFVLPD